LYELAENVYIEEGTIRFYGVRLQTRMAVVRLSGDRLFVYSPVPLAAGVRERLDALGRVGFVVSPNKIHNQTLADYRAAYPEARFFAPPGLPERRPDLRFDSVLGDRPEPEWADELDQALTGGNAFFTEVLFHHRASRSLLVGDFVENITPETTSRLGWWVCRAYGLGSGPTPSPEFSIYTHDPRAARDSLERPRAWPIDRIFLCHGDTIEREASAAFDSVCEQLIATAQRRGPIWRWATARLAALQ